MAIPSVSGMAENRAEDELIEIRETGDAGAILYGGYGR